MKQQIVMIDGPSGSGKTTIGNKIKNKYKNVLVVDSDKIDDGNFLYLYENNKKFREMIQKQKGKPYDIHNKLNIKKRNKIIAKNKDKHIIFIGFTVPLGDIKHIRYYIDIDPKLNFQRINSRTLDSICDNKKEIKEILKKENPNAFDMLTLYKYEIRQRFPIVYNNLKKGNMTKRKNARKKGYKVMKADKIIPDLEKTLKLELKGGSYYEKYIKYKSKYLNLKGGNKNNDNIVKILGKGYNGISYLMKNNGNVYVLKRQKMLDEEVTENLNYKIWREIDFLKYIKKLSVKDQSFFMKMYNYNITKCNYIHIPDYIDPNYSEELNKRNESKMCLDIKLEYKGNTLDKIISKLDSNEIYCMLIQIIYALGVIRKDNYIHQDIHQGNITYKNTSKNIKISNKILNCKYQYSLIDYGEVKHKKYINNQKEINNFNKDFNSNNDIFQLIYQIILQQYMLYGIYIEKKLEFPKFNTDKIFEQMSKEKNVWNKIKTKLSGKGKKYLDWFKNYDRTKKIDNNDYIITEQIEYLFSAYNRKKYLKIMGWDVYLPNLIPSEDIEYIVMNIIDNNKLIGYFYNKIVKNPKINYDNYSLIGIGEFSHGILESWEFRFDMLKDIIKNTKKNVTIFIELSIWQGENIMNNTYYDRNRKKYLKYDGIKIEKPVYINNKQPFWGELWQYVHYTSESNIFLDIIKYVRKNKNKITLIGVDNDTVSRDYDMYKIIMKNLDKENINLFWAHNAHVDNRKLGDHDKKWTNETHYCGYYLKKELGNKYCIILSNAYEGENRFNSYCSGDGCEKRIWKKEYFYHKFKYEPNKKYVNPNKSYRLLDIYHNKFIEFSNSYYKDNKYGYQEVIDSDTWTYVLFWNKVSKLPPYTNY